jgi:hypothetical protein
MLTVLSIDEPEMMLIEKAGVGSVGEAEEADDAITQPEIEICGRPGPKTGQGLPGSSLTVTVLTGVEAMGKAELLIGTVEAPTGGMTAPGVEQMVVVVATTVVDVSKTVAPAGQSAGTMHSDV